MSEHAATRLGNTPHEALPKPKVMRRPAQFSTSAASPLLADTIPPALLTIRPLSPTAPAAVASPALAWQHDSRFAIALLSVVLVFNVAVYYALSHSKASSPSRHTSTAGAHSAIAPDVHILDDSKSVALIEP